MLSNLIVNQEKFVLLIDNIGIENQSLEILKKFLSEQNENICEFFNISDDDGVIGAETKSLSDKTAIILTALSKILYQYDPEALFQFINKLKTDTNINQIFAWATVKNIQEHFVIPFLEHMADITVNIIDIANLSILIRKQDFVTKKYYTYQIVGEVFDVAEVTTIPQKKSLESSIKRENLSTFKISLNEEEIVARNTLKLPYEKSDEEKKGSNSKQTPDSDDQFNDEDPDEDLFI